MALETFRGQLAVASADRALRRAGMATPKPPRQGRSRAIRWLGYASALLLPVVGLIVGLVLVVRNSQRMHGWLMVGIAIASIAVGVAMGPVRTTRPRPTRVEVSTHPRIDVSGLPPEVRRGVEEAERIDSETP